MESIQEKRKQSETIEPLYIVKTIENNDHICFKQDCYQFIINNEETPDGVNPVHGIFC